MSPWRPALGRNRQPVGEGKGRLTSQNGKLAQQLFHLQPEKKTRDWDGGWPLAGRKQSGTGDRAEGAKPVP